MKGNSNKISKNLYLDIILLVDSNQDIGDFLEGYIISYLLVLVSVS